HATLAKADRSPVPFIVGAARSGTTLLRLMLDAHPDLAIPAETNFIPRIIKETQESTNPREQFYHSLVSLEYWDDFALDRETLRERLATIRPFDVADGVRCFFEIYAERQGKPRWGDKTPMYLRHMTVIQDVLPEARFIHLIRDGRDVALSNKALW